MKKVCVLILFSISFIVSGQTEVNPEIALSESSGISISPASQIKTEEHIITNAFAGMRDQYNIPIDLYGVDRVLKLKMNIYESSKSTETTLGITSLITMPLGIIIGVVFPELVWAPYNSRTRIPWGYAIAAAGGGVGLYNLFGVMPKTREYRIEFFDYFNKTYGSYR